MNMEQQSKMTVHDFETIKVLGKGSYAKVNLVRKRSNHKIYAMKILKKKYLEKKRQEFHTQTEKKILEIINHPFVIEMKYSFQSEKKLFMVLEFCQGGELFNLLCKARSFNEEVCKFYAAQIVLALQHLHDNDILYRDLKPENVLIDQTGYIKITDFGLSKVDIKDDTGSTFSVCGTPEYLAPEVLAKTGHGKSSDWWTLGCIIYEMVIGQPAFINNDRRTLFNMIKTNDITFPPKAKLSIEIKDLLYKLFCKDPLQRLGAGQNGSENVKNHPWFQNVNWDAIMNKSIIPPFVPKQQKDDGTIYFEQEFLAMDPNSISDCSPMNNIFAYEGWSYSRSLHKDNLNKDDDEQNNDQMIMEQDTDVIFNDLDTQRQNIK